MRKRSLSNFTIFIVFFLLAFIPTNIFFIDGIDSIVLLVVTPLLLLFAISKYSKCLKNKEIKLLFVWFLWVCITCCTALVPSYSFNLLNTIAGGVMMSLIYYMFSHEKKMIPFLYGVYIFILIAEIYYASHTFVGMGTDIRANDEKLNANSLAYMTFYSICGIYFLGELVNNKRISKIFKIAFFVMVLVAVYVAFITASRQVLPTALTAWLLLFVQRYVKKINAGRVVFIIIIAISGYFLYSYVFESMYSDSLLATRTEHTDNTDTRILVLYEALEVSSKHLFFGVGPGNFVHLSQLGIFSHNSYAEILVSSGLLGLFLYLAIVTQFLKQQLRRYRITNDQIFLSIFMIGIVWTVYNVLYVFYVGVYLIPFLFLLMGHSDFLYREKINNQMLY